MARRFGFGKSTGIDLDGEKSGTVPGRDWKRANYDTGWRVRLSSLPSGRAIYYNTCN